MCTQSCPAVCNILVGGLKQLNLWFSYSLAINHVKEALKEQTLKTYFEQLHQLFHIQFSIQY